MDNLILEDVVNKTTYNLTVDIPTAERARKDVVFATKLLKNYLDTPTIAAFDQSSSGPSDNETYEYLSPPRAGTDSHQVISTSDRDDGSRHGETSRCLSQPSILTKTLCLGSTNGKTFGCSRQLSILTQTLGLNSNTDSTNKHILSNNVTVWTHDETIALIDAYDIFKEHFNNAKKRRHVWASIATFLESKGIFKNEKVCETKWKNLLRTCKTIKDTISRTGRGSVRFQYMEEMETVIGKRPIVSSQFATGVGVSSSVKPTSEPSFQLNSQQNDETPLENPSDNSLDNPKENKNINEQESHSKKKKSICKCLSFVKTGLFKSKIRRYQG